MVQGYDAMLLLADAVTRAGSLDGAKIRDALAATDGFEGVTGTFRFDENRNPMKRAVIMEIKNGRTHFLKTIEP
jgi:branched-chain amino acid transport system substrate-binding protein